MKTFRKINYHRIAYVTELQTNQQAQVSLIIYLQFW